MTLLSLDTTTARARLIAVAAFYNEGCLIAWPYGHVAVGDMHAKTVGIANRFRLRFSLPFDFLFLASSKHRRGSVKKLGPFQE